MPQEEGKQVEEVVVQPEGQETPQQEAPKQEEKSYTAIELKAMEQGWKPLEEWVEEGNDASEHRSAREFVDRGELLGKIKALGSENRRAQEMLQALSEQNRQVYKAGYEKGIRDLKNLKKEALKDGDADAVVEIDERIDQHKEALRRLEQAPQTNAQAAPSALYQDWLRENSWYKEDTSLRHWANGMAAEYGANNPGVTEQEIYDYLSKEVRKLHPDRFRRKDTVRSAPQPDGQGRRVGGAQSAGKKSVDDRFEEILKGMNELDARTARNLVKQEWVTKEKYVEDYLAVTGGQ